MQYSDLSPWYQVVTYIHKIVVNHIENVPYVPIATKE